MRKIRNGLEAFKFFRKAADFLGMEANCVQIRSQADGRVVSALLRVGLEASEIANCHRAIGRYARELSLALARLAGPEGLDLGLFIFGRRCRERSAGFLRELRDAGKARAVSFPVPGKILFWCWRRLGAPSIERFLGELDVLHATHLIVPPAPPRARTLMTLHGAVNFVRPDLLDRRYTAGYVKLWTQEARRADWILSVSETSRRDFLERFDFPPERVRTIPLGVSAGFRPLPEDELERKLGERFGALGLRRPYILFVGGLQRVKNVRGLLAAFRILAEGRQIPHRLVLAGKMHDAREEIAEALRAGALSRQVLFTGHLPQEGDDLPVLYGAADLLVQPSYYEGWASPPLEAMACGTPVVASTARSLIESCGDAALHADPGDPRAIAQAIERVLGDRELREGLIRRGLAWSARWTWERTARSTLDIYREAALSDPRRGAHGPQKPS